ncbi:MAG: ATP-dependent RNA helicase DbpA [Gammaproteobacteria bacterium]|nr:ATP-dependent RNA helicase DbpA [Gammaproteobacteria bacterium]MBT6891785.1 ATP-dependent RNA helicase DbpA [Gammaproteobacteria bacterium]
MDSSNPDSGKTGFKNVELHAELLSNLDDLGFHSMTPIQALSLPEILDGKDVIAQAKTGSGKTAAFGLGILNKLNVRKFRVQCLILCPTRELADQVAKEIRTLGRKIHNIKVLTLCGGVAFGPQKGSLEHGAHIVVGTPGRTEEHLRKQNLSLENLTTFVLDEADRMLDMGFGESIAQIIRYLPAKRQNMLFSATYPQNIDKLAAKVMVNPQRLEAPDQHDANTIQQLLCQITDKSKRTEGLVSLLQKYKPDSTLVFCNTKQLADDVSLELRNLGFSARAIHGDLEQRDRDNRLVQFSNNSLSILVATDVAARGLDIDSLDLVVNYHLSRDPEVHTHRIGRTGRAGNTGLACSLFHESENYKIELLEAVLEQSLERIVIAPLDPGFRPAQPSMATLQIDGGKKQKVRPGDLLGALTGANGIEGSAVGKISIFDRTAYVAIKRTSSKQALAVLNAGKIKGRSFRARKL